MEAEHAVENGQDHAVDHERTRSSELTAEQELVVRLKTAIDQRGRYSYRLNDLSAGYAAGKGISNMAARVAIEEQFARQTGQTPQEYLDKHYEELNQVRQGR